MLSVMIIMLCFYRLQVKLEPYKLKLNNRLERLEFIAGTFTIFGGTLFVDDENDVVVVKIIVFILILFINCRFVLFWIYSMMQTFRDQYRLIDLLASLISYLLCLKEKRSQTLKSPKVRKKQHSEKRSAKVGNKTSLKNSHNKKLMEESKNASKYIDESIFHEENKVVQKVQFRDLPHDDFGLDDSCHENQVRKQFEIGKTNKSKNNSISDLFMDKFQEIGKIVIEDNASNSNQEFSNIFESSKTMSPFRAQNVAFLSSSNSKINQKL